MIRNSVALICLLALPPAQAVDYYRCTQANGTTVFSESPCGPNAVREQVEATPGVSPGAATPSAIDQLENYREQVRHIEKLTGSKARSDPAKPKQDPCQGVSSLQLRNARISKSVTKCHSMDDIQAMFGSPDRVYTWSDRKAYDTRYLYRSTDKGRLNVYFKDGRVTRWSSRN